MGQDGAASIFQKLRDGPNLKFRKAYHSRFYSGPPIGHLKEGPTTAPV
jgi:hypothetical protein